MTTNQEGVHAAVQAVTGTSASYLSDWHALFDDDSITVGSWNSRMIAWVNQTLGTSYASLNDAMNAFAIDQGFASWQDMNTFSLSNAALLLGNESGFAVDFTDDTLEIID